MQQGLERYRKITRLAEDAFRIPGLGIRVGIDALIGLIPGFGDIAGGVLAGYGILVAWRAGAPASLLIRMLGNIAVDTVVGEIPIAGDLFDIAWKSNSKNYRLLERFTAEPERTARASRGLLIGIITGLLLLLALCAWISVQVVLFLFHYIAASP
jgi:Domain of unknown function (DUF4112)